MIHYLAFIGSYDLHLFVVVLCVEGLKKDHMSPEKFPLVTDPGIDVNTTTANATADFKEKYVVEIGVISYIALSAIAFIVLLTCVGRIKKRAERAAYGNPRPI